MRLALKTKLGKKCLECNQYIVSFGYQKMFVFVVKEIVGSTHVAGRYVLVVQTHETAWDQHFASSHKTQGSGGSPEYRFFYS